MSSTLPTQTKTTLQASDETIGAKDATTFVVAMRDTIKFLLHSQEAVLDHCKQIDKRLNAFRLVLELESKQFKEVSKRLQALEARLDRWESNAQRQADELCSRTVDVICSRAELYASTPPQE